MIERQRRENPDEDIVVPHMTCKNVPAHSAIIAIGYIRNVDSRPWKWYSGETSTELPVCYVCARKTTMATRFHAY